MSKREPTAPSNVGNAASGANAPHGAAGHDAATADAKPATVITDSRIAAAQVCAELRTGELLDAAFDRRTARLDPRDRRWTRELLYGMLRRRAVIDAHLDARVRGGLPRLDAELLDLLRLGAMQLLYMGSVPAYAAIGQTVELAKRRNGIGASKLANAVLRQVDRDRATLSLPVVSDPVEAAALAESHPGWLVERWVGRWGLEDTRRLMRANNSEAPIVARPVHVVREQLEAMFEAAGVHVEDAPLARDSVVLAGPATSFTELEAYRRGVFHIQDPASTLVTAYASPPAGAVIADLCAAPGGKSIELSRTARLVAASDVSFARLRRVQENIARLDLGVVAPYVADARSPALRPVDCVLLDAPCSGTGTFRRHPDARWRLEPGNIVSLAALQRELLLGAASVTRPGGLLVYSTCSIETEENDAVVEAFLREHAEWRLEPPPAGAVPDETLDGGMLRVLPHLHGTDGAFAARLRRAA